LFCVLVVISQQHNYTAFATTALSDPVEKVFV